jgi:hypothetical protein
MTREQQRWGVYNNTTGILMIKMDIIIMTTTTIRATMTALKPEKQKQKGMEMGEMGMRWGSACAVFLNESRIWKRKLMEMNAITTKRGAWMPLWRIMMIMMKICFIFRWGEAAGIRWYGIGGRMRSLEPGPLTE